MTVRNGEEPRARGSAQRSGGPAEGPLRVLLVEDNKFVTELIRHAVIRFQAGIAPHLAPQVQVASSGVEALPMIEHGEIDVLIVDHYLPGLTGCALVRRLRELPRHERTPVLMVSTGGDEIRRKAMEAGATLYMDKPALMSQLLDTLHTLVPIAQEATP